MQRYLLWVFVLVPVLAVAQRLPPVTLTIDKTQFDDGYPSQLIRLEIDGDPRTEEAMLYRLQQNVAAPIKVIAICPDGSVGMTRWFSLWEGLTLHEPSFGWIEFIAGRHRVVVQGKLVYQERFLPLPACRSGTS